ILEWVGERETALVADPLQCLQRLADMRALEDDLGTVSATGGDLRRIGTDRHDDRHGDARFAPGPRVGLAGVAGGHGDRATLPLRRLERGDPVRHPAGLERPGLLEVLGLQVETAITEPRAVRLREKSRRS